MGQLIEQIIGSEQVQLAAIIFPRLIVTVILCGFIGVEREHMNRPAGVRTHVLVGVAAALVMVTSEFMFVHYQGVASIDPTRLGAQVVSGIGFLGAGTIIKEGFNVKGLTTAASLWAVSCIGLAVGCGFYSGAIIATGVIYGTLEFFKKLMERYSNNRILHIRMTNMDETLRVVKAELEKVNINVPTIEVLINQSKTETELKIYLIIPEEKGVLEYTIARIKDMEDVVELYIS